MELKFESRTDSSVVVTTHLGWDLKFTITRDHTNNIRNVSVAGTIAENNEAKLFASSNGIAMGAEVRFYGIQYDRTLTNDVLDKIETIFEGESEVIDG